MLVPVALLVLVYLLQLRRRSAYAIRFATLPMLERLAPKRPAWRRRALTSLSSSRRSNDWLPPPWSRIRRWPSTLTQ